MFERLWLQENASLQRAPLDFSVTSAHLHRGNNAEQSQRPRAEQRRDHGSRSSGPVSQVRMKEVEEVSSRSFLFWTF